MEVKLGSVPVQTGGGEFPSLLLEVVLADVRESDTHPDAAIYRRVVKLQVREEGRRSTFLPILLTPAAARALAALLVLPVQTP